MTKIMLVEDDNNLREIYEARLAAEGYDIVSAPDGESALALAARERPELIITDVMMPKISGFEMLDILRNTENLKDVKVIMLTALGQAEDNARANSLGADRYLVKSQVTLEDIIKATHDVLEGPAPVDAQATDSGFSLDAQDSPQAPQESPADLPITAAPAATESLPIAEAPAFFDEPTVGQPAAVDPLSQTLPPADDPAASDDAVTSDPLPVSDDFDDNVWRPQAGLGDVPVSEEAVAAPIAEESQPASDTESDIRAQIDQFLDKESDDAVEIPTDALPEEAETELAKNEATPDMGILSVHDDPQAQAEPQPAPADETPAPAPVAEPAPAPAPEPTPEQAPLTAAPTPGYPSQPFELPFASAQPARQEESPSSPQAADDQLVSDAVSDMIASTPPPVPQQPAQPAPAPTPGNTDVSSPESQAQTTPYGNPTPVSHKRVIAPLGQPSRPDINQLLALENAKAAAAANNPAPQQPAQQWQQQNPNNPPVDPNSISL